MGIREVRVYTCDGCSHRDTFGRNEAAHGWYTVKLNRSGELILCSVCYNAVEWVAKFQGITVPPKIYKGPDNKYSLRTFQEREPGKFLCVKDPGCPTEEGGEGLNDLSHSANCVRKNHILPPTRDQRSESLEEEDDDDLSF